MSEENNTAASCIIGVNMHGKQPTSRLRLSTSPRIRPSFSVSIAERTSPSIPNNRLLHGSGGLGSYPTGYMALMVHDEDDNMIDMGDSRMYQLGGAMGVKQRVVCNVRCAMIIFV